MGLCVLHLAVGRYGLCSVLGEQEHADRAAEGVRLVREDEGVGYIWTDRNEGGITRSAGLGTIDAERRVPKYGVKPGPARKPSLYQEHTRNAQAVVTSDI